MAIKFFQEKEKEMEVKTGGRLEGGGVIFYTITLFTHPHSEETCEIERGEGQSQK